MEVRHKESSSEKGKYFKYQFAIVLIATISFLYLAWYSYRTQIVTDVDPATLPLIDFDRQIKFKPGDSGGAEIKNLDKGIYDYISGRKSSKKVVIANSREEPLSRKEMRFVINRDLGKETRIVPPVVSKVSHAKKVSQKKSLQKKKVTKPSVKKDYYVRIAKLKNPDVKDRAWKVLHKKHVSILANFNPSVFKESKEGHINYYLHVGPIGSKRKALSICRKLISKGNACKVH